MCGIAGFFDPKRGSGAHALEHMAGRMGDSLLHRGPDAGGVWVDAAQGIALAHRRLAIIDLSPSGAQPMFSADGRYVISYNGEIYNYQVIADELRAAGHRVTGSGDTAALLAAFAAWGVRETLTKINGIFAFAVWDREARQLTLARDPMGVKPLYWAKAGVKYLFGSELRALFEHPDCPRTIDRAALARYFRTGNVPAPLSIIAGIQKLRPAHYLILEAGQEPRQVCYWDLAALTAAARPATDIAFADAVEHLHDLLRDAVKGQMLSDVPLGALLSGGIDSSTVAALMQSQSAQPIKTFSVGFRHGDFDEAPHARAIARHLGTAHTEVYVTDADARAVIPRLPQIYDEPFADSSQIPTYLVSKVARKHVTVALSGDGGDEVFLGYNRYRAWARLEVLPAPLRRHFARLCSKIPAEFWNRLGMMLPARLHIPQIGDKLIKFAAFQDDDVRQVYSRLVSWWLNPEELVPEAPLVPFDLPQISRADPVTAMQLWDMLGYLPDDVLTKVDRASMAVALEVRVPLLDRAIVEYGLNLPRDYKLEGGLAKRILRAVTARYIPPLLFDRPKSGFGVPLAAWLRGPLREWAEDCLTPAMLREAQLNEAPIRRSWEDHLALRANNQHQIWTVLMYLAWRREWSGA